MRKGKLTLLLVALCFLNTHAQNKWDRPMVLKSCTIDITADMFTASTFIEMEFYNANNQEMEGLFRFELKPGQVITAFQLDLSGKYRDGSIEEKWKATNAYNTIVGKRIDPALLTMESPNHYSLRIYPVPGKGTRKITMTVQQMLTPENNQLHYYFPLNVNDQVDNFKLSIKAASQNNVPLVSTGLLAGQLFRKTGDHFLLEWSTKDILLKKPIAFAIPVPATSIVCIKRGEVQTHFAVRLWPAVHRDYELQPKHLAIYWDASASATKRDLRKEISFLRQFVAYHGITRLTIVSFNHKMLGKTVFESANLNSNRWVQHLQSMQYSGATQLGAVDLAGVTADMFMLFSDGNNTFGKSQPRIGTALVYAVHSAPNANHTLLNDIVGANGGKVIDLAKKSLSDAIYLNSRADNWLLNVTSSAGKAIVEQRFPQRIGNSIVINGTMSSDTDTLYFHYGNNNTVNHVEKLIISKRNYCNESAMDRITMLEDHPVRIQSYNWENILDFGLVEKVVTQNTAFIVLERIEDYVKYNITPPKDLEKECERINYVKKDGRIQRQQKKAADEFDILNGVVNYYNSRLKFWDSDQSLLNFNRIDYTNDKMERVAIGDASPGATSNPPVVLRGNMSMGAVANESPMGNDLQEVVVVGYGSSRKRSFTGAMSHVSAEEMMRFQTVEAALQGRVAGLVVTNTFSTPGFVGDIRIRGSQSGVNGGSPLFVLDGIPVFDNINSYISTHDIENITVLKDAAGTALYGSQGANGVILINSKKGKNSSTYSNKPYRLKDMEDVEYLEAIRKAEMNEQMTVYLELKEQYGDLPAFYLDMAQHFFDINMVEEAKAMLMDAAEISNGSFQVLRAIGYILESKKQFDEAIAIYEQLVYDYEDNIYSHRDLAWACYQDQQYQRAVNILIAAIKRDTKQAEWNNLQLKAMLLAEVNAMINIHKDQLDLSAIPAALIRPTTADLRIVLDCNKGNPSGISIKEPGGETCSYTRPQTKAGGLLGTNYAYWQTNIPAEYQMKKAQAGRYRITLNYYNYRSLPDKVPAYVRIVTFKNFGKTGQSITVENVVMDNQYGEVEIGEVKW